MSPFSCHSIYCFSSPGNFPNKLLTLLPRIHCPQPAFVPCPHQRTAIVVTTTSDKLHTVNSVNTFLTSPSSGSQQHLMWLPISLFLKHTPCSPFCGGFPPASLASPSQTLSWFVGIQLTSDFGTLQSLVLCSFIIFQWEQQIIAHEVNQRSRPGEMDHPARFPSSLPEEPAKKARTAQWGRKKTCSVRY